MPGCSAFGCSNRSEQGYLMKTFPRDPIRRQQWIAQTGRSNWFPTGRASLCEIHFEDSMWEKTRVDGSRKLKCNAIPTLFNFTKTKPKKTYSSTSISSNINPGDNTIPKVLNFTENRPTRTYVLPLNKSTPQDLSSSDVKPSRVNPVLIVRDTSMDILIPETNSVTISRTESSGCKTLYADSNELKQQLTNVRIKNKKLRLNNRMLRNKLRNTMREKQILQLKLKNLKRVMVNHRSQEKNKE